MRKPSTSLAAGLASVLLVLTCGCASNPAAVTGGESDSPAEAQATEEDKGDATEDEPENAVKLSEGTGESAQVSVGRFDELSTMSIGGATYQFSLPASQVIADGWELRDAAPLEANSLDRFFLTVESRDAYNAEKDSYVTLYLLNETEEEMAAVDAELIGMGVKIGSQGAGTDVTIAGGLTLGSSMSELIDELGEPYDDGVARAENEGFNDETAGVTWRFEDPNGSTLEIKSSINRETLKAETLQVRLA